MVAGRRFQILDGCPPPLVSGTLLGLDIVLNVNEQADFPLRCWGCLEGLGPSGNAGETTVASV